MLNVAAHQCAGAAQVPARTGHVAHPGHGAMQRLLHFLHGGADLGRWHVSKQRHARQQQQDAATHDAALAERIACMGGGAGNSSVLIAG